MNEFLKQIGQEKLKFETLATNYVDGFAGILKMESANTANSERNVKFIIDKYNEMFSAFEKLASDKTLELFVNCGEEFNPLLKFAKNELYLILVKKHGEIQKLLMQHKNYDSHLSFIL